MNKLNRFLKSVGHAVQGILFLFKAQYNIIYMIIIGVVAVVLTFVLKISKIETVIIIMTCFIVVILETMNTAFEKLIDKIHPKYDKRIGAVKDLLAGSVLFASIMAVIVGLVIFLEPITMIFKNIFIK